MQIIKHCCVISPTSRPFLSCLTYSPDRRPILPGFHPLSSLTNWPSYETNREQVMSVRGDCRAYISLCAMVTLFFFRDTVAITAALCICQHALCNLYVYTLDSHASCTTKSPFRAPLNNSLRCRLKYQDISS